MQTTNAENNKSQNVYFVGAASALLVVLIFRRYLSAEFVISNGFGIFSVPNPMPIQAEDWFKLILSDPVVGLLLLDFFDIINYLLVGIIFYALYFHIRQARLSLSVIALGLGLMGILVYLLSNPALRMLVLAVRYVNASQVQQVRLLSAGETILHISLQSFGVNLGLFLVLTSGLLFSILMLKDNAFGKATSIFGLLANGIGLLYFPILFLEPELSWLPPTIEALFRMGWNILIAVDLMKLGRSKTTFLLNNKLEEDE